MISGWVALLCFFSHRVEFHNEMDALCRGDASTEGSLESVDARDLRSHRYNVRIHVKKCCVYDAQISLDDIIRWQCCERLVERHTKTSYCSEMSVLCNVAGVSQRLVRQCV